MLRAVMFDMDGTIGDTLPMCVGAFQKTMRETLGRELTEAEIFATFGPSEDGILQRLVPDRFEEAYALFLKHYDSMHGMCPTPFDGVMDLLRYLRGKEGLVLALVTGKGRKSADITLARYGLDAMFDDEETGSPVAQRKEAAMRRILAKHRIEPGEAVYIGDSPMDVVESRRVGVPVYGAAWAATTDREALAKAGPDKIFDSVADLAAHLRRELGD